MPPTTLQSSFCFSFSHLHVLLCRQTSGPMSVPSGDRHPPPPAKLASPIKGLQTQCLPSQAPAAATKHSCLILRREIESRSMPFSQEILEEHTEREREASPPQPSLSPPPNLSQCPFQRRGGVGGYFRGFSFSSSLHIHSSHHLYRRDGVFIWGHYTIRLRLVSGDIHIHRQAGTSTCPCLPQPPTHLHLTSPCPSSFSSIEKTSPFPQK